MEIDWWDRTDFYIPKEIKEKILKALPEKIPVCLSDPEANDKLCSLITNVLFDAVYDPDFPGNVGAVSRIYPSLSLTLPVANQYFEGWVEKEVEKRLEIYPSFYIARCDCGTRLLDFMPDYLSTWEHEPDCPICGKRMEMEPFNKYNDEHLKVLLESPYKEMVSDLYDIPELFFDDARRLIEDKHA